MSGRRWIGVVLVTFVALAGCDDPARPGIDDATRPEAESLLDRQDADIIPGHWIVVLDDDVADPPGAARGLARAHGLELRHTYTAALKGFAAVVPAARLDALRADPRVRYLSPDRLDRVYQQSVPTGIDRIEAELNDSVADPVDVDIAILDTGIDLDHPDLNVYRAVSFAGGSGDDGMGHGTHVAGTAAALDDGSGVVGVAPGARLWAVKVCKNSGRCSRSDIIAGIDFVVDSAEAIEVANMSLGGPGSDDGACGTFDGDAEHAAICGAVAKGVVFVVAAGNRGNDAANYAPAAYGEVITVSALADFDGQPRGEAASTCRSDDDDSFAGFSNWGADVDIMAPGVCIESTWKGGGYNTITGTSMAAPHVTGTAALYIAVNGRDANGDGHRDGADAAYVRDALVAAGIPQDDEACGLAVPDDPDNYAEPIVFANAFNVGGDGKCGGQDPPSPTVTDIAITSVSAPSVAEPGTDIDVTVTVQNVGGLDVTDDITVTLVTDNATPANGTDDLPPIGRQVINGGLEAGFSRSLTFSWDTEGANLGDHTLTASHGLVDDDDANDSAAAAVTLVATMHSGNLDRASTNGSQGGTWRAWVRITVHDAAEDALADVTVTGHWDSGFTETPSCTTNATGMCQVSLDGIPNRDGNVVFTIDAMSHATIRYDATANHDPEADITVDGTSIRVFFHNSDDYLK